MQQIVPFGSKREICIFNRGNCLNLSRSNGTENFNLYKYIFVELPEKNLL